MTQSKLRITHKPQAYLKPEDHIKAALRPTSWA